jgi:hypothetical protein
MSRVIFQNNTQARISFYTHDLFNNRIDVYDPLRPDGTPGPTSLVSYDWRKSLGEPSGKIEITLKAYSVETIGGAPQPSIPWTKRIKEGDWWTLDVIKNGQKFQTGFGKIDKISLSIAAGGNGSGVTVVRVSGRDFAFGLESTPVYFNPHDEAIDNAVGVNMLRILDSVDGKPDAVIVNLIKGLMGYGRVENPILGGYFRVPTGITSTLSTKWVSGLNTDPTSFPGGTVQDNLKGMALLTSLITPTGAPSVWSLCDAWRNPCLNELFIDCSATPPKLPGGRSASLIMREKPYENIVDGLNSPWFKLRNWNVDARTLTMLAIEKGANRVNHLLLLGDLEPEWGRDAYAVYKPIYNSKSIEQHGLCRLEENTRYFDDPTSGAVGHPTIGTGWAWLIACWNALNHEYWAGRMDIGEMRPEIKIGERVTLLNGPPANYGGLPRDLGVEAAGLSFYVEAVQHTYEEGEKPIARTSLTITRGYQDVNRLPDMAAELMNWDGIPVPLPSSNVGELNATTAGQQFVLDALSRRSQAGLPGVNDLLEQ